MTINPFLWLIVALLSLLPVYIFWIGYRKTHTRDLFITASAFTLFLVKALTLAVALFLDGLNEEKWYFDDEFWVGVAAVLDMFIIGLIASALMGRFGPQNGHDPVIPTVNGEDGDVDDPHSTTDTSTAGDPAPQPRPTSAPKSDPDPGVSPMDQKSESPPE